MNNYVNKYMTEAEFEKIQAELGTKVAMDKYKENILVCRAESRNYKNLAKKANKKLTEKQERRKQDSEKKRLNRVKKHIILRNNSIHNEIRSAIATNNKPLKEQNLHRMANIMRQAPWPSEIWFNKLYEPFRHNKDSFQEVFNGYVADIINHDFKYCIEIDGSIHDKQEVKTRDAKKDQALNYYGYQVFRVRHNDYLQFRNVINELAKIREIDLTKLPNYNNIPRI